MASCCCIEILEATPDELIEFLGCFCVRWLQFACFIGGFNPFETYESTWKSSPNKDEHKTYLKPPPR